MWNFFSRETFPYEIGEKYNDFLNCSVFSLHKGIKKASGEKVSIFTFNVKTGNSAFCENARVTIKKLKTLRHPSILTYIYSYEDENVIHLVTEPVVPLLTYLEQIKHLETCEMYLKWGLSTIAEAVAFLNEHDQRHNNIFHGAVFVDTSGSWKLGEIGYITNDTAAYPYKVIDNLARYKPPSNYPPRSSDYWGLGILLWETFNGEVQIAENLSKPRSVPKSLISTFQDLTKHSINKQEIISTLIERCSKNNMLFTTLDNLQHYHLKDKDVKSKVCKDLLALMPNIPKDMLLNKVLKLLKQAYEFDIDNSAFLVPVVSKIPSYISEEEFQSSVESFVITLFSSNDRATRLALLMNIEEIINKINQKSINDLFPYVSTGFLDSNPKIRGETVKALVYFAPKLSKRQLNDDALRHLIQIQAKDIEPYIRINSTICLGKIAHCLQPDTRKKVLVTSFLQALRDPVPGVRNAGVQAFGVTSRFFPLEMIGRNVLPGLAYLSVDPDPTVCQNALKTIKVLVAKLEKFSESPELREELEKDVMSHNVDSSSSWSGWAFTAITSKFLKPTESRAKINDQESSDNKTTSDESQKQMSASSNSNLLKESNASEPARKDSFYDYKTRKSSTESNQSYKAEGTNTFADDISEEDKSDWENDGWGEAHEEVLEPSQTKPLPKLADTQKKKTFGGPTKKLGTRLSKYD